MCRSDVQLVDGYFAEALNPEFPITSGHEIARLVAALGDRRVEVSYARKEKQECLPRGCTSCFVLETSSGSPSLCSTPTEVRRNPVARWLRPKDEQARQQCGASFVRGVTEA